VTERMFEELRRMTWRQIASQFFNFAMIVASALMIWKGLMVVTNSESPIVVVLRCGTNIASLCLVPVVEELVR
jgi:hypothetical protein